MRSLGQFQTFFFTKRLYMRKKHKKYKDATKQKHKKTQKAQRRNQAKSQKTQKSK